MSIVEFKVGQTYWDRSLGDHNCVWNFTILGRTAKTVTVNVYGKPAKRGVFVWDSVERFRPFGTYSMCAVVSAERVQS